MDHFFTHISSRAIELVEQTLRSTRVSEGSLVARFEELLSSRLGLANPIAVNSGTSALHLALDVCGVGPDDEVILAPQTFVATGLAVLMQRARPVFADINPETGNIDAARLGEKVSERTRAIMAVHWAGYPCDLDEINSIANEHNIPVIEDAAHALGATYKGRPVGTISRMTCFSFQAIKHLTTGDGGALCCLNSGDALAARKGRWFGIDRQRDLPDHLGERVYDLTRLGYKYHMNDLAAALGIGNLEDFSGQLARRREICARYRARLAGTDGLRMLNYSQDRESAWWLFTVLVDSRDSFIRKLVSHQIQASVVHRRIDRHSVFGGVAKDLVGQTYFDEHQVSLPCHPGLSDQDVEHVSNVVSSGW